MRKGREILKELFGVKAGYATYGKNPSDLRTLLTPENKGIMVTALKGLDKLKKGSYIVFHLWGLFREEALFFLWDGWVGYIQGDLFTHTKKEDLHYPLEKEHIFEVKFAQLGKPSSYEIVAIVNDKTANKNIITKRMPDEWGSEITGSDIAMEFCYEDYSPEEVDWITCEGLYKYSQSGLTEKMQGNDFIWTSDMNIFSPVDVEHREEYEDEWQKKVELRIVKGKPVQLPQLPMPIRSIIPEIKALMSR